MEKIPKMIQLPDLAIWLICDQLSYEDLRNLRATCKQLLKAIIDQRPYRSLHLYVACHPYERELFYTDELIFYANTLHIGDPRILKSIKFQKQFNGLRKFTILSPSLKPKVVDLNDLNCFQELVHLEVDYFGIEGDKLSLRNLKILLLDCAKDAHDLSFVLDCPRLEALGVDPRIQLRLTAETSDSLKHLFLDHAYESVLYQMILSGELKNLSTFSVATDSDLNNFVLAIMEDRLCLPSLKRINLKLEGRFIDIALLARNLVKFKNRHEHCEVVIERKVMSLDQLIKLQNVVEKHFPSKVPEDPDREYTYDWGALYSERFVTCVEEPILDCFLPGIDALVLESDEDVTLCKQLIGKLRNVNCLNLGKGITLDDQFFDCMLKTCRKVLLSYIYCPLSKEQLNRMPDYFQALQDLVLANDFLPDDLNDLDFLAKFKNLRRLSLDFNLDPETISFLLTNCSHSEKFSLVFFLDCGPILGVSMGMKRKKNGRFRVVQKHYKGDVLLKTKRTDFDRVEQAVEYYQEKILANPPGLKPWARCCLM